MLRKLNHERCAGFGRLFNVLKKSTSGERTHPAAMAPGNAGRVANHGLI